MDYELPDGDGISLVRRFGRSHPTTLFFGVAADDEQEQAFFEAGASGFLSKPFSVQELGAMLRESEILDDEVHTSPTQ